MALDILTYISKLKDDEGVDIEEISNKLGYPKEKVQQILNQAKRKRSHGEVPSQKGYKGF